MRPDLEDTQRTDGLLLASCAFFFCFGRFLFAGSDFSYDYWAYHAFFSALKYDRWGDILQSGSSSFPYVLIRGLPPFEIGFVLLAKVVTVGLEDATSAIAFLASLSVAVRTFVLKRLGMPTSAMILSQIYAVTLFEANALRLGVAATIVAVALLQFSKKRQGLGQLLLFTALLFHLQVTLLAVPFSVLWSTRSLWYTSRARIALLAFCGAGSILVLVQVPLLSDLQKLESYVAQSSSSAGLTVTSVLAAMLTISALASSGGRMSRTGGESIVELANVRTVLLVAAVPSLTLFIAVANIAVLGDRAWQLAFVSLLPFLLGRWSYRKVSAPRALALACLVLALFNVTVRYPLANLLSPPLPPVVNLPRG
jgi:hypothetical protein